MADVTLTGATRPKSAITNSVSVPILVTADSHNDTTDQSVEYIQFENLPPIPATIEPSEDVATTSGNAVITITGATFTYNGTAGDYDVRVGDGVAGTGIGASAKVASVDSATQLTLDVNSTATGTINDLVITPPTFDSNMFAIVKNYTVSGSNLTLRVRVFRSDGSSNIDSNADGADNSTWADYGSAVQDVSVQLNLDTFLTNQRNNRAA
jgi:hypothetical protein